MTQTQTTAANLTEFAELLKDNGFTPIVSKRGIESWMFFSKMGSLAMYQKTG